MKKKMGSHKNHQKLWNSPSLKQYDFISFLTVYIRNGVILRISSGDKF